MPQQPPVFIANRPVYVLGQDGKLPEADVVIRLSGNEPQGFLVPILRSFEENRLASALAILSGNPASTFSNLISTFRMIDAAGGIVISPGGRMLMIFRNGIWDLPKGKLEPGESPEVGGVREVEEECGLEGITLNAEATTTYHCYTYRDEQVVKRTFWFLMDCVEEVDGVPQTEEGITEVRWMNRSEALRALENGSSSIRLAVQPFIHLLRDEA